MSNRDLAKNLIDKIPESKLFYVISYLQGAAVPDETPNADTLEAFAELDNGGGHSFGGTTEQLFNEFDVKAIESVLAKGDRVELIPVKDGIKIIEVKRRVIKSNNSKPAPYGAKQEETGSNNE